MTDDTRGMIAISVAVVVVLLEHAGWGWPRRRFEAWLNSGGAQ